MLQRAGSVSTMTGGPEVTGSRFGPWTLDAQLGAGLLGDVWSARNDAGEEVALKRLHPDLTKTLSARFIACVEATRGLDHPRIPAVIAVREHVDGRAVVVRTLIQGESATSFSARRRGRVPPAEALRIVEGAARAVAHAHEQGVLHGALHASHVLLSNDGSVSVVDFNLSELRQDAALELELPGPPDPEQYEAPEASFAATPEADVWSLGALLFLLLTGEHARQSGAEIPRHLTEFAPDAPEQLLDILARSLSLDPDARLSPTQLAGACRLLRHDPVVAGLQRIAAATVFLDADDGARVSAPPTSTRRQSRSKIASSASGTREAVPAGSDPTPVENELPPELDLSDVRDPRFESESAPAPASTQHADADLARARTVPAHGSDPTQAATLGRPAVTSSFPPPLDETTQPPPHAQRYSSRPPVTKNPSFELMLEVPAAPKSSDPSDAIDVGDIVVGDDAASRQELERLAGILAFDSALMLEDAFADGQSQPPRRLDSRFWRRLSIAARPANAAEVDLSADLERCLDVAARVLVDSAAAGVLGRGHAGVDELLANSCPTPDQLVDLIAQVDRECTEARLSSVAHAAAACSVLTPRNLEVLLGSAGWSSLSSGRRSLLRAALRHLDAGYLAPIASALCGSHDPELSEDLSERLARLVEEREDSLVEVALGADFPGALKLVRVLTQLSTPGARAALEAIGTGHALALIRIEALAGAEGLTGSRVRAELTAVLDAEPNEEARVHALRTIRDFELRAAGPHLAMRIKSSAFYGLSHEEKRQLLHALGVIMPPRAEAIAGEILLDTKLLESSAHEESRMLAADLLGAIASTPDSKEILEEAATKRWGAKESVRAAAERALSHWAERNRRKQAGG
jgi:serine/threonine-protein kinase